MQGLLPADLLIRKEFDCGVGNNSHAVGAIALEHALDALFVVHVFATLQIAALDGQSFQFNFFTFADFQIPNLHMP